MAGENMDDCRRSASCLWHTGTRCYVATRIVSPLPSFGQLHVPGRDEQRAPKHGAALPLLGTQHSTPQHDTEVCSLKNPVLECDLTLKPNLQLVESSLINSVCAKRKLYLKSACRENHLYAEREHGCFWSAKEYEKFLEKQMKMENACRGTWSSC